MICAQITSPAIQWQRCYGGSYDDAPGSITKTIDGGYIIAGDAQSNNGDVSGNHNTSGYFYDYWVVKLYPDPVSIKEEKLEEEIVVYPNPAHNTISITNAEKGDIHIYNVLGEEVINASSNASIDVSKLSKGTYIIKVVGKENIVMKKFIKYD